MAIGNDQVATPVGGRRRRRVVCMGAAVGIALAVSACGASSSSSGTTAAVPTTSSGSPGTTTATSSGTAVVYAAPRGTLGVLLTDGLNGPTLYRYTPDGTGKTTCTGACAAAWPPLTVPAGTTTVAGGPGVPKGRLGTLTRPDGTLQVTFNGMPLYRYAGDTQATQTNGQGVEGVWFVVSPSASAASSSSSVPAGSSSSTTPTTKVSGY